MKLRWFHVFIHYTDLYLSITSLHIYSEFLFCSWCCCCCYFVSFWEVNRYTIYHRVAFVFIELVLSVYVKRVFSSLLSRVYEYWFICKQKFLDITSFSLNNNTNRSKFQHLFGCVSCVCKMLAFIRTAMHLNNCIHRTFLLHSFNYRPCDIMRIVNFRWIPSNRLNLFSKRWQNTINVHVRLQYFSLILRRKKLNNTYDLTVVNIQLIVLYPITFHTNKYWIFYDSLILFMSTVLVDIFDFVLSLFFLSVMSVM